MIEKGLRSTLKPGLFQRQNCNLRSYLKYFECEVSLYQIPWRRATVHNIKQYCNRLPAATNSCSGGRIRSEYSD